MNKSDKRTALVVDDNAANSFILASLMGRLGFEAEEASSGREAINCVCQKEYDLILMDHLMPELDGIQTIEQILFMSEGKKRPVILGVSATVDQDVVQAFQNAGAKDVLEKPVRIEKLEEKLQDLFMDSEESSLPQEVEEETTIDIEEVLSSVEGLDYRQGLELMSGSVENYMKVLAVSAKNILENYNAIELICGNTHLENVALYFHSLKGIFLNIGAGELAENSKNLELAAKEGQYDWVRCEMGGYLEQVKEFLTKLSAACDAYQVEKGLEKPAEEISSSDFAGKLRELRAHIEDFEYIEITELLEQMLAGVSGKQREELKKIDEAIQEFEYDRAIEILDALYESDGME